MYVAENATIMLISGLSLNVDADNIYIYKGVFVHKANTKLTSNKFILIVRGLGTAKCLCGRQFGP